MPSYTKGYNMPTQRLRLKALLQPKALPHRATLRSAAHSLFPVYAVKRVARRIATCFQWVVGAAGAVESVIGLWQAEKTQSKCATRAWTAEGGAQSSHSVGGEKEQPEGATTVVRVPGCNRKGRGGVDVGG